MGPVKGPELFPLAVALVPGLPGPSFMLFSAAIVCPSREQRLFVCLRFLSWVSGSTSSCGSPLCKCPPSGDLWLFPGWEDVFDTRGNWSFQEQAGGWGWAPSRGLGAQVDPENQWEEPRGRWAVLSPSVQPQFAPTPDLGWWTLCCWIPARADPSVPLPDPP